MNVFNKIQDGIKLQVAQDVCVTGDLNFTGKIEHAINGQARLAPDDLLDERWADHVSLQDEVHYFTVM